MTSVLERPHQSQESVYSPTVQEQIGATSNFRDAAIIYRDCYPSESLAMDIVSPQLAYDSLNMLIDRYGDHLDPEEQEFVISESANLSHAIVSSEREHVTMPGLYRIVNIIDLLQTQSPDRAQDAVKDLKTGIETVKNYSPLDQKMIDSLDIAVKQYTSPASNGQQLGDILAKIIRHDTSVAQNMTELSMERKLIESGELRAPSPHVERLKKARTSIRASVRRLFSRP